MCDPLFERILEGERPRRDRTTHGYEYMNHRVSHSVNVCGAEARRGGAPRASASNTRRHHNRRQAVAANMKLHGYAIHGTHSAYYAQLTQLPCRRGCSTTTISTIHITNTHTLHLRAHAQGRPPFTRRVPHTPVALVTEDGT
jgi:hypothetical protein